MNMILLFSFMVVVYNVVARLKSAVFSFDYNMWDICILAARKST